MFSIFLKPNFLIAQYAFWLSAIVAVSVAKALELYVPEVKVKWPNDLLINGLKVGGLLIENTVSGQKLDQSVVGIGININQISVLPTATSLALEGRQEFDREEILAAILSEISTGYFYLQQMGWEKVRSVYYSKLYKMAVLREYFLPDGQPFKAILKSISDRGELILLCKDGEKRFQFKEVRF